LPARRNYTMRIDFRLTAGPPAAMVAAPISLAGDSTKSSPVVLPDRRRSPPANALYAEIRASPGRVVAVVGQSLAVSAATELRLGFVMVCQVLPPKCVQVRKRMESWRWRAERVRFVHLRATRYGGSHRVGEPTFACWWSSLAGLPAVARSPMQASEGWRRGWDSFPAISLPSTIWARSETPESPNPLET
jgi:hypothetical protein